MLTSPKNLCELLVKILCGKLGSINGSEAEKDDDVALYVTV